MKAWTRRSLVGGAALVFLIGGTALAYTWPSSDGELHACAQKNSGALRLVAAADSCKSDEIPVAWNVQGPAGPQGVQGAPGPQGPPGPTAPGGIVWKDATGAIVPIVQQGAAVDAGAFQGSTATYLFFDTAGVIWTYTPTANPSVTATFPASTTPLLYYASSDCSGPAYVDASLFFAARQTYGMGTETRVVVDNPPTTSLNVGSYQQGASSMTANDGYCNQTSDTRTVIAVTSTYVVTTPSFPYVLPIHAEPAQ